MVHGRREDDLGAGRSQFLELQDQVLQLGHTAAAHLDEEGVSARDVVALQHLLAVLHQLHQLVAVAGGDGKADEGVHVHAVGRAVEHHGVAADDAVGLKLVDAAGNGGAGGRGSCGLNRP